MAGFGRVNRTEPHPVLKEPAPHRQEFPPEHGFGGEPQRPGRGAPGGAEAHRGGLRIIANFREPHVGVREVLKQRADLNGRILYRSI